MKPLPLLTLCRMEQAPCEACRATTAAGHAFRASLAQVFDVDGAAFPCPLGRRWGWRRSWWRRALGYWIAVWRRPSLGLGDTVAKVTKTIGIQPCGGCKERQAALNRLVPYATKE